MTSLAQDMTPQPQHHDLSGDAVQFLTFRIDKGEYGVDIMTVREIKGWSETTRLPNMPAFMRGVINLRGVVVPIFDLRCRFNMGTTEVNPKNVVIILAVAERTIGILVDAVSDILTINADEIKALPNNETQIDEAFINGLISVDERMVVLLSINKLFDKESIEAGQDITGPIGSSAKVQSFL